MNTIKDILNNEIVWYHATLNSAHIKDQTEEAELLISLYYLFLKHIPQKEIDNKIVFEFKTQDEILFLGFKDNILSLGTEFTSHYGPSFLEINKTLNAHSLN